MATPVTARSLLRRGRRTDSWFLSGAGLNLYRGCAHDCAFCDGRAETYQVDGEFGRDVQAKTNAPELLEQELRAAERRGFSGFVLVGGGVGDSWQPAEREHGLARRTLELLERTAFDVHVLTRSSLVLRDLELLVRLARTRRVLVSFSFSGLDDAAAAVFEPGSPPPSERLRAMETLRNKGIPSGVYLMPVLPWLGDSDEALAAVLAAVRDAGAQWVCPAGLTLKEGRQKEHFLRVLGAHRPELVARYEALYRGDRWGAPTGRPPRPHGTLEAATLAHGLALRIPRRLFPRLAERDLVLVLLEHMEACARARREPSPWGKAAATLGASAEPVQRQLAAGALDGAVEAAVRAILRTGTCPEYERLVTAAAPGNRDRQGAASDLH